MGGRVAVAEGVSVGGRVAVAEGVSVGGRVAVAEGVGVDVRAGGRVVVGTGERRAVGLGVMDAAEGRQAIKEASSQNRTGPTQ